MLGFAVLRGISGSLVWMATIAVLGHWFSEKRGIATGLATTAGGFGGIIFPLLIERLMPQLGYTRTICVIASIAAFSSFVSLLLLSPRIPTSPTKSLMFDMDGFKDPTFSLAVSLPWTLPVE